MEDSGIDSGDPKPSNSKDDIEFFNTVRIKKNTTKPSDSRSLKCAYAVKRLEAT